MRQCRRVSGRSKHNTCSTPKSKRVRTVSPGSPRGPCGPVIPGGPVIPFKRRRWSTTTHDKRSGVVSDTSKGAVMWTVKTLTGGPSGPYDPVNSVPCRNAGGGGGGGETSSSELYTFQQVMLLLDLRTTPKSFSFLRSCRKQ